MDTETAETSTHPDLPQEQAYLDRAYECLEDMRHGTVEYRDRQFDNVLSSKGVRI